MDDLNQEERQQLIDEAVSMKYPVNWSMLWIVVKRVNADGEDRNGKKAHIDVEMSEEKKAYVGMGEDLWRTSAWLKDGSKGRN
ncbi:MAG: hypothetical protein E7232_08800 [Lachnospiraceae bacterium]|nr:hypothetical protein [Lachnospiraceae bacterium]